MAHYTAYYYDPTRDSGVEGDTNELSMNGVYISNFTHVRSSENIEDLAPQNENEHLLIIVLSDTTIDIENHNPCPDFSYD